MGVWDMMYLMQQHKKALALAWSPNLSEEKQAEYAEKAEVSRQQMIRYLEQVEKQIGVQEILERNL
jgi:DNA-binding transcriptional regulator LsrR (DeoR family)